MVLYKYNYINLSILIIVKLKMQLVWIIFNISNEVIGFVRDKTGMIIKKYAVRESHPHLHKNWRA